MALQNLLGDLALDSSSQAILEELGKKADLTELQPVILNSIASAVLDLLHANESYILDNDNKSILRVHEAAPWVYCKDATGALSFIRTDPNGVVNTISTPSTPYMDNLTMAVINTQYGSSVPINCKSIRIRIRGGLATDTYRISFESGKVAAPTAPYLTLTQAEMYVIDNINFSGIVFLASSAANKVAQIEYWA